MKNSDHQDLVYRGSFSTLQTQGNSQYMKHGAISFTEKQNELYSRLLKGLKYYSKEELYAMNSNKKNRIKKSHKKAQDLLNVWKQELMILLSNSIFEQYDLKESRTIVKEDEPNECIKLKLSDIFGDTDPNFKCTLTFKELGLNKEIIANKFVENRLLPADFISL